MFTQIKTTEVKTHTQFIGKKLRFNFKLFLSKSALVYVLYCNEDS